MVTDLGFLVHTDEIELRPDSNLIHFSKNDKINSQMEKNDPGNIVTKSYKTILNRLPDEDGFEFFTNQLKRKNLLEKELKVLLVKSDEYKTNLENLFTNIINNR